MIMFNNSTKITLEYKFFLAKLILYMIHQIWSQKALFLPLIIFCRIQTAPKQKSMYTVLYIISHCIWLSNTANCCYKICQLPIWKTLCISSAPAKKFTHLTFRRLRVLHIPAERTQHVLVSSMRVKLVEKNHVVPNTIHQRKYWLLFFF